MRWFFLPLVFWSTVCHAQFGPPQVVVAPVERRSIEQTQPLVATVEPVTYTTLAAEDGGLVSERLFDEGDAVEARSVLVRTNVELLEAQRVTAQAARDSAAAMIERARSDAENAARELQRLEGLYKNAVTSEKEYQDAVAMHRAMDAMLLVREAELAEKAAEVARLDLLIRKSEIRTPLAGVVARRHVEVGQWIKQGDAVAEIVQLDPLFVRVNVPERVIVSIQRGDEAIVTIDALRGRELKGKVEQILPEGDRSSRTFPVKILLPNPEKVIRPGFFARAVLTWRSESDLFTVPRDALVMRGEQAHVVAVRDGAAVIVPVTRGAATGDRVAVEGELRDGDEVVVRGNEQLRGGERVIVQNQPAAISQPERKG